MNYFTLFPLSGYWGKFLGLAVSTPALLLLIAIQVISSETLPPILAPENANIILIYFLCLGLFIITFSKEKIDDERVQKVRYTSLRAMAYFYAIGIFCVLAPFANNKEEVAQSVISGDFSLIFLLLVLPLLVYQVVFNIGLYLNPGWVYNDLGAEENIRKHPKFFLLYSGAIILLFLIFLAAKALFTT